MEDDINFKMERRLSPQLVDVVSDMVPVIYKQSLLDADHLRHYLS